MKLPTMLPFNERELDQGMPFCLGMGLLLLLGAGIGAKKLVLAVVLIRCKRETSEWL